MPQSAIPHQLPGVAVCYTGRDFSSTSKNKGFVYFLGGSYEEFSRLCICHCPCAEWRSCARPAKGDGAERTRNLLYVGAELPESSPRRDSRRSRWSGDEFQRPHLRLSP